MTAQKRPACPKGHSGWRNAALLAVLMSFFIAAALAGNVIISVDFTNPNATILNVTENSAYALAIQNGTDWALWYNNASTGNFTVGANAQDNSSGSGIVNITWPTTTSAGGTNTTPASFDVNFTWTYDWDNADTSDFTDQVVTVYDNASNSNTSWNNFDIIWDNTPPTTTDNGPSDNITWSDAWSVLVNLTASDNVGGSGYNFTAFCSYNSGGPLCSLTNISYAVPISLNFSCSVGECSYIVRYFSGDNVANNESIKNTNQINILKLPDISGIECANDSHVYKSCSSFVYGETIWKVRANVTAGGYPVSNVVFKLDNAEDSKTVFYGAYVERTGNEYRYYWNNPLLDSGTLNLTVTAIDTDGNSNSASVNWSVPFGTLGAVTNPSSNISMMRNQTFIFNATYSCSGGECGDINAVLNFNASLFSASPGATITKGTTACLGGVDGGETCTASWSVTATGGKDNYSQFYAQGVPQNYSISTANSTPFNISIVNSPPTMPAIESPISGSSVSNLTIIFDWSDSTDIDGDSFNYTIQVDNNSDYSSPENATNITDSNATITVPNFATWFWRVRACDAWNCSDWATAFVSVVSGGGNITDTIPPFIILTSPANGTWLPAGNVTFAYQASDAMSPIANCSLYVNGTLNATNTSVINGADGGFVVLMPVGSYSWMIGCTDNASTPNSANSTPRIVRIDDAAPTITSLSIVYPVGQSEATDGQSVMVDVNVSDAGSGVSSVVVNCSALGSGFAGATLQSGDGSSGTWRATCLVNGPSSFEGGVNISVNASDAVGFFAVNVTAVAIDNLAPSNPAYLNITARPADTDGVIFLSWPASISVDVALYNIYRSNVNDFVPISGLLIANTNATNFTDVPPSDDTWYWKVTSVDNLGHENVTGAPQNWTLVDTGAPTLSNMTITYPQLVINPSVAQTRVKNGDSLLIVAQATDPQNISAVWVDISTINTSLGNVSMRDDGLGGDATANDSFYTYNATIGGTAGVSNQTIRLYANDTSGNVRNGVYARVAVDNTAPTIAVSDDGNFTSTTTSMHANWTYTDTGSDSLGFTYMIYNNLGEYVTNGTWTTFTDVIKVVNPPLVEGMTYFWYVAAYDGAGNSANSTTAPEGIMVDTVPPVFVYVNDTGNTTNVATQLNATWLAQDLESGIRRYFYRIGEDNNSDTIIDAYFHYNISDGVWRFASGGNTTPWREMGGNTSVSATIDSLSMNRTYYFEVKAENWAGVSALGRSDGIYTTNVTAVCGNSIVEAGEQCDSLNLSGQTCVSRGFASGTLGCNSTCMFNTSACVAALCGNGRIEPGEQCDGANLSSLACTVFDGYTGGTLNCTGACMLNLSNCTGGTAGVCGNSVVDANETCDAANLSALLCTNFSFTGGFLSCSACQINTSSCSNTSVCGNAVIDGVEQCDGGNLNGQTCVSRGFASGTLGCAGSCTFDTSGCVAALPAPSGGGYGGAPTPPTESKTIASIGANQCIDAQLLKYDVHGIKSIRLCVKRSLTNSVIQLNVRESPPQVKTTDPSQLYLDISKSGFTDADIANVTFTVAVSKSWLAKDSVDYRKFNLMKWSNSSWQEMNTEWAYSDDTYQYYYAYSSSLSLFALSGPKATCPKTCPEPSLWSSCINGTRTRTEYPCDVDTGFSCEPRTASIECKPALMCPTCPEPSAWSNCTDGAQSRTEYSCGADTDYQCAARTVTQACEECLCPEPGLWSECMNGTQLRTAYRCGAETSYSCKTYSESRWCMPAAFLILVGIIALLVIIVAFILATRQRIARWFRRPRKHAPRHVVRHVARHAPRHVVRRIARYVARHMHAHVVKKEEKPEPAPVVKKEEPVPMPAMLAIKSKIAARMTGKPRYVCSVCGKPEILIHWCESCGQETCLQHIHKVGTKLYCDNCMKKKKLM